MANAKKTQVAEIETVEGVVFDPEDLIRIKERYEGLTAKQRRWLDAFMVNRNASKSAQIAGYNGTDTSLRKIGNDNKKSLNEIIQWFDAESLRVVEIISNLEGIYNFWGKVLVDQRNSMKDRLKASELLARALGAFDGEADAMNRVGNDPYKGITEKELKALAKLRK